MKESYIEGLANHDDPESCASARKSDGEALRGARTGRILSRENRQIRDADAVMLGGRQYDMARNRERHDGPARSKTPGTYGISSREDREILRSSSTQAVKKRGRKAFSRTLPMHDPGESDSFVVPAKSPNKGREAAEVMEGRRLTEVSTVEQNASRTQSRTGAHNALDRVR